MAIDTRNRRASAIGWGLASLRTWPAPDGRLDLVSDRQHMAYLYAIASDGSADTSSWFTIRHYSESSDLRPQPEQPQRRRRDDEDEELLAIFG